MLIKKVKLLKAQRLLREKQLIVYLCMEDTHEEAEETTT